MGLPNTGQLSLGDIAGEFGGAEPHALSEYYGEGNSPNSGEIKIGTHFYGATFDFFAGKTSANLHVYNNSGSFSIPANVGKIGIWACGGGGGDQIGYNSYYGRGAGAIVGVFSTGGMGGSINFTVGVDGATTSSGYNVTDGNPSYVYAANGETIIVGDGGDGWSTSGAAAPTGDGYIGNYSASDETYKGNNGTGSNYLDTNPTNASRYAQNVGNIQNNAPSFIRDTNYNHGIGSNNGGSTNGSVILIY